MSRNRRSACRDCGASGNDTHISLAGLCETCGIRRQRQARDEITTQSGPAYEHWLQRVIAANVPAGRPPTTYPPDA